MRKFLLGAAVILSTWMATGCGGTENAGALPANPPPDAGLKAVDQMKSGGTGPMQPTAPPK